ncbi:MAG TPA: hypothetical protein VGK58_05655 [Lacipirellulaceae bacterium]
MRRYTHISLMLAALIVLMSGDALWAKGGRGGSKGGGGKSHQGGSGFHGHGGGGKSSSGSTHRGKTKPSFATKHNVKKHVHNDSEEPWTKHHAREQRKLEHRQRVADHLREVSDRNGNEHLKQVADDMDERAQAHYDKQIEKINRKYGDDDDAAHDADEGEHDADHSHDDAHESLDDSHEFHNETNENVDELTRKLTGTENAAARQLRNETRKLTRRMEAVERMRALGEETGNESMLQEADRLEQQALDHFHQRMEKIGEFRQRHGLPDIEHHHAP